MNQFKRFTDFLNANATGASQGRSRPSPTPTTGQSSQSGTKGTTPPKGSHHIERKKVMFRQVGPNDIIDAEEQQWRQNGGTMEGDTLQTRVITSDGQLADPSELQSVCSQCNRMLDTVIRSEISHVTLCRVCQRIFEMPDGKKVVVTPQEYAQLAYQYDTWARYDAKRKGGAK